MWHLYRRLDLNNQPLLLSLLLIRTCSPMLAALSCHTQQSPVSTTHVGTHPVRPAGAKRSASTAHAGNHNSNGPCLRTEVTPFPKPNAVGTPHAQPWALQNLRPQPRRHSGQRYHASSISPFPLTVESRPGAQKSHQYCLRCLCVNSMQLSSRKPVTMFPHISAYFLAYTDNTDLAILL